MRLTEKEYEELTARRIVIDRHPQLATPTLAEHGAKHGLVPKSGKANKTESEYCFRLQCEFKGCSVIFEAISFHLANGHTYTPDYCVKLPDGNLLFVEVKARGANGFRQPSYQRAKMAFDQLRVEYPIFRYRWAEKCKGEWTVKDYE